MDKIWDFISDKMSTIQSGLLRFQDKQGKNSFEIKDIKPDHASSVNFVLPEYEDSKKLINHSASLTQRTDNGYLYVTGLISRTKQEDMFSMTVQKAYWFTKKGKGKTSWFEEICVYDHLQRD
jgi:hypothetical protein